MYAKNKKRALLEDGAARAALSKVSARLSDLHQAAKDNRAAIDCPAIASFTGKEHLLPAILSNDRLKENLCNFSGNGLLFCKRPLNSRISTRLMTVCCAIFIIYILNLLASDLCRRTIPLSAARVETCNQPTLSRRLRLLGRRSKQIEQRIVPVIQSNVSGRHALYRSCQMSALPIGKKSQIGKVFAAHPTSQHL